MKIALIGASGFVGSALRQELLSRGHSVTALVSDPSKLAAAERLAVSKVDVFDTAALTAALAGHDAVLSAFSGHANADVRGYYVRGLDSILAAVRAAKQRLLIVGGAGSLEVAPGVQLLDTPGFPAAYRGSAEGARDALVRLRGEAGLDWTMLSPAAMLLPGERSGVFRLGDDALLVGADGQSRITVADFAVAMVDELERPTHAGRRFTVGY
jgi:hypothetical protein